MNTIHLLFPASAEAYNYDHPILGHIELPDALESFKWFHHDVLARQHKKWLHVTIKGDNLEEIRRTAQYQIDRLASGLYHTYSAETS